MPNTTLGIARLNELAILVSGSKEITLLKSRTVEECSLSI